MKACALRYVTLSSFNKTPKPVKHSLHSEIDRRSFDIYCSIYYPVPVKHELDFQREQGTFPSPQHPNRTIGPPGSYPVSTGRISPEDKRFAT
jgi:hypothetical protein